MPEGTRWVDVTEGRDETNPKTDKPYSHTLNKNEKKQGDKEPDYRGMLHLRLTAELMEIITNNDGKLSCNLSAWRRDGKNGPFLSMQLQHAIDAAPEHGGENLSALEKAAMDESTEPF
jgi:hypothetical protein